MKRLLSTLILLCLLIPSLLFADEPIQLARMNPWVAGSVASCSSTQEQNATCASTSPFNNGTRYYSAVSFTAGSSYTLYHATVVLRRFNNGGGGNIAFYVCTNNTTPNPDVPSATCVEADATKSLASMTGGADSITFDFSAGYAIESGNRYWYKIIPDSVGDDSNYLQQYYNATGSEIVSYSTDTTPTWVGQDTAASACYTNSSCQ